MTLCQGHQRVAVEGFDRGRVQHRGLDPLGSQQFRGLQADGGAQAAAHQQHIPALPHHHGLAELEAVVFRVDAGELVAGEADVDGSLMRVGGANRLPGFNGVGRREDGHARDHSHEGQILQALMGAAILAHGEACVGGDDLDVLAAHAHGLPDKFIGPARGEHGEGADEGDHARGGGPGRGGHFTGKKKDDKRTRAERMAEELELKLRQPRSRAQQIATEYVNDEIGIVMLSEGVSVKELAEKCNRPAKDVVAKLLHRGIFATINQPLDTDLAKEIGPLYQKLKSKSPKINSISFCNGGFSAIRLPFSEIILCPPKTTLEVDSVWPVET